MHDALARICADKAGHVAARKAEMPASAVEAAAREASPARGFHAALRSESGRGRHGLITEIKKASPSKGLIRRDFDPARLAGAYERGGATCLSVLTDGPYFQGADSHLRAARERVSLPVLRKDFMIDPYQVAEARMLGADCILVVLAAVDDGLAAEIEAAAFEWSMDVLVEIHDGDELERAAKLRSPLLGINNRDLRTLETDIRTTVELAPRARDAGRLVVSESGLSDASDLKAMRDAGASAFLIGEALMRRPDVEAATRLLRAGRGPGKETARCRG